MAKQLSTRKPAVVSFQWPWRKISRFQLLLCLMLVSTAMWIAFAKLVVPPIIESAYRGESLPFFNNMIKGQYANPISYYREKWDRLAVDYLLIGVQIWVLILVVSSRTFLRVFRTFLGEATPGLSTNGVPSGEIVRHIPELPFTPGRYVFNLFSILALALICVPLTIGAIWAFPIWDDAWVWLILNENGTGILRAAWGDRPIVANLWSLLATSEHAFWYASFVAQALTWPLLGLISALLWIHLFPGLQRYAMVVACVAVAPIICKLQMITANIALAHLLSVVLSYGAFFLLLRFVKADDRFGRAALAVSVPMLAFAILLTEYALPVVVVMVILFWSGARRAPDPATKLRARRAIVFSTLIGGTAYAIFFIIADYTARPGGWEVSPFYVLTGGADLTPFTFRVAQGIWWSVVGSFVTSMGKITLTSSSGIMAAAYGALIAGLLFYGSRNPQHNVKSRSTNTLSERGVLTAAMALVAGLVPFVLMHRIPWHTADAIQSRYELPLLAITASLIVFVSLSLVRQRFWAVPILLLGFVAGNATFAEVWSAIRERQQMSALGVALQSHVSSKDGITVAAVALPERSLGPRRPYELTVRLAATWPPELRRRFWAFRLGDGPPNYAAFNEAESIFGSRADCKSPQAFKWSFRYVTRDGPLGQLLWVKPQTDGSISVEPYCVRDQNENHDAHGTLTHH
jgi:hypothetical protein